MIVMQGFLTAKKYTYSIVGSEDLEKANSLLYDTYHPDEPLNRCSMSSELMVTSVQCEAVRQQNFARILQDRLQKPF